MAWGQLGKLLEIAITTASAVIVVRTLAPKGFGTYSLLTNLAGAASVFIPVVATESLGAVLPRLVDRGRRIWTVWMLIALRLSVIVVVALVVIALWTTVSSGLGLGHVSVRVLVVAFVYWMSQDILNTVGGLYLSELELRPLTLWRVSGQAVTLVGVLALALTGRIAVGTVLVAAVIGYAASAFGLAAALVRHPVRRPTPEQVRWVLGYTRHTWLIGVLTLTLATQVDVIMIGALTGSVGEAALYVAAVGIVGRAQSLFVSGWSSVIIPTLGAAQRAGGLPGLARAARLFGELWLLVMLPLNALVLGLAVPLVNVLFGADYHRSGELLVVFTLTTIAATVALGPPALGALWALDKQPLVTRVRIVVGIINVGLAVVLIPSFGAMGAVVATGAAAILSSLCELALALRAQAIAYPVAVLARTAPAAALAAVVAWLAPDSTAGLVLGLVGGFTVCVGALLVLRPLRREHLDLLAAIDPRLPATALRRLARP